MTVWVVETYEGVDREAGAFLSEVAALRYYHKHAYSPTNVFGAIGAAPLEVYDPDFDEHCPVGRWHDPPDPSDDPSPNMHCTCWYDGDGCCRCKAPGLTKEQRIEQGMDEES